MAKKVINKKRKGHNYERQIATFYRELGYEAKRSIQSRGAKDEGCDVEVPELNIWVECSHRKSSGLVGKKYRQACVDSEGTGRIPILHYHADRPKNHQDERQGYHLVVMDRKIWERIVRELSSSKLSGALFARGD